MQKTSQGLKKPKPAGWWECECKEDAVLHRVVKGKHEYLCNECIKRSEE